MPVAPRRPVAVVHGVVHEVRAQHGNERLGLRKLDELALAGALAVVQGGQDRECAVSAARRVAHKHRRHGGGVHVLVAPQHGVADHAVHVQSEAAVVAVGAGVAVGGHAHHDNARVDLSEALVGDREALHRASGVVLDEHVAHLDEPVQHLLALGPEQVDGHAQLVAGVGVEQGSAVPGPVSGDSAGQPGEVVGAVIQLLLAGSRPGAAGGGGRERLSGLDADDLCPHVGKEGRAVWPRPHDGQVQHADALQRQCSGARLRRHRSSSAPRCPRRCSQAPRALPACAGPAGARAGGATRGSGP